MNLVRLKEVADILRGVTFDKSEARLESAHGYVPVLRAGNISERLRLRDDLIWIPENRVSNIQRLRPLDIVMCASSGSAALVGKSAAVEEEWAGTFGAFCVAIRVRDEGLDPRFLQFALRSAKFRAWSRQAQGINIKNIKKSELEAYTIVMPHLDEQRRIVALLTRVARLKRLADDATRKAREVILSLFADMFGDQPYQRWPVRQFGTLARETQLGLVRAASETGNDKPFPYVRMNAITSDGELDLTDLKRVKATSAEVERYGLRNGDFLFNTRNSRELVGKVAVFAGDEVHLFNNNILRVRFVEEVDPVFVAAAFASPQIQRELELRKSGTTSVCAIYYRSLATLPVPVPPATLQREFAARVQEITSVRLLAQAAAATSEVTSAALMSRLFSC